MKTVLLCFLTLGIKFVSSNNSTTEGTCNRRKVFCQYMGQSWANNYTFRMDDLQNALDRCQIVVYGQYYFQRRNTVNTHVWQSDKNALRSLVECGVPVYIVIGYLDPAGWSEVFDPPDDVLFDYHVNTLVAFIKKYNISGVIFENTLDLFSPYSPYTVDGITSFIAKIRSGAESLKVGLFLRGTSYQSFSDSKIFDVSCMNTILDYFFIDMTVLNFCDAGTRCESTNPVTSQNSTITTIEQVSIAVKNSAMDQCKVIAMLLVSTIESIEDFNANNDEDVSGTYSELCMAANSGKDFVSRLCFASTSVLYNQGKFVRDYFSGVMINVLEGDDTACACKCRPFVATNSILDGWDCSELQICPGIDNLLN